MTEQQQELLNKSCRISDAAWQFSQLQQLLAMPTRRRPSPARNLQTTAAAPGAAAVATSHAAADAAVYDQASVHETEPAAGQRFCDVYSSERYSICVLESMSTGSAEPPGSGADRDCTATSSGNTRISSDCCI